MSCPKCNSGNVAEIFWGYPATMDGISKELEQGTLVLGGCCVSGNDPKWECNECSFRWGKRDN